MLQDHRTIVTEEAEAICDATGMTEEELRAALEKIFVQFDADGSGALEQNEFVRCMAVVGKSLGLDERTVLKVHFGGGGGGGGGGI